MPAIAGLPRWATGAAKCWAETYLSFLAGDSGLDRQSVIDIIAEGELDNEPRSYTTRSGETIETLVSSRAERGSDGRVRRLHVAMKDVTERNRAERRLRAAFEENARLRRELERERDYLREEVQVSMNFGRIIGESPALKKMLARVEAVAQTSASVLIQGESGTGKELVAHVIHTRSARSGGPLVKVNCASIPSELFESEFFGHVKGAFTGAHRDRHRPLPTGRRRHAVHGRDRRNPPRSAGQAAAGAPGGRIRAGGRATAPAR